MATGMVPDELIHVENNVILTTKDLIRVQQLFNYLSTNLDKFRVGSEFVVLCGVHDFSLFINKKFALNEMFQNLLYFMYK